MTDHNHVDCDALLSSLSSYIDGDLAPELCREIEKHLEGCDNCRVVLNTTRRTIDLVRDGQSQPLPDDVRDRLFKRLSLEGYLKKE